MEISRRALLLGLGGLPFVGNNRYHSDWRDGFLCLAYLRPDGFAGLAPDTPGGHGHVVMLPLPSLSGELRVSCDAAAGGVTVTAIGEDGVTLARGAPVRADVTDGLVTWQTGSAAALAGRVVRLRFDLSASRLYAFTLS